MEECGCELTIMILNALLFLTHLLITDLFCFWLHTVSDQFSRYKFVLILFRSFIHIFSSLEHALLFWITQSRHVGRISRSPKRGSPEGKEKKRGPSPLSFSHAFWTKLSSSPGLDILPLHSWLESSVERWVENSSHSFQALWAAADVPLRELISIQAERCVITLNKWWS